MIVKTIIIKIFLTFSYTILYFDKNYVTDNEGVKKLLKLYSPMLGSRRW